MCWLLSGFFVLIVLRHSWFSQVFTSNKSRMHRQKARLIYQNGSENKPDFFLLNLGLDPRLFKPAWQASKKEGNGSEKGSERPRFALFSLSLPLILHFPRCLRTWATPFLKELDNHFKQYQAFIILSVPADKCPGSQGREGTLGSQLSHNCIHSSHTCITYVKRRGWREWGLCDAIENCLKKLSQGRSGDAIHLELIRTRRVVS